MNYSEFINNIITSRGQWNIPEGEYYENHHIIPLCMGGEPEKWKHNTKHPNLIWLTLEEHYEAHRLLVLENKDNNSLSYAFWRLTNNGLNLTSEEFIKSKQLFLENLNKEKLSIAAKLRCSKYTEEQKESIISKVKENWANKSEEEINLIVSKRKETLANKSEEDKLIEHNNRSEAHIGLSTGKRTKEQVAKSVAGRKANNNLTEVANKIWVKRRANGTDKGYRIDSTKRCIKVRCVETGEIFNSIKEASEWCKGDVGRVCRGKRKTAGGYKWEYLSEVL